MSHLASSIQALATLAAIVISGVISLVDYSEAIYLWKVHKFDFSVWLVAFLGTLFLGVELGLGIAVGISLLLVIFESAYPHTAVLGRLSGTHQYRNIKQYPDAEQYDGIVLIRVDAPIYFANSQHVRDKIHKYYQRAEEKLHAEEESTESDAEGSEERPLNVEEHEVKRVRFVILELNPVSHLDTSALHMLAELNSTMKKDKEIQVLLSNPNPRVMRKLVQSGLADEIGRDHIFVSLHDAVQYGLSHMDTVEVKRRISSIASMRQLGEQSSHSQSGACGALPLSPINAEPGGNDDLEVGLDLSPSEQEIRGES